MLYHTECPAPADDRRPRKQRQRPARLRQTGQKSPKQKSTKPHATSDEKATNKHTERHTDTTHELMNRSTLNPRSHEQPESCHASAKSSRGFVSRDLWHARNRTRKDSRSLRAKLLPPKQTTSIALIFIMIIAAAHSLRGVIIPD